MSDRLTYVSQVLGPGKDEDILKGHMCASPLAYQTTKTTDAKKLISPGILDGEKEKGQSLPGAGQRGAGLLKEISLVLTHQTIWLDRLEPRQ